MLSVQKEALSGLKIGKVDLLSGFTMLLVIIVLLCLLKMTLNSALKNV